uniref:Uncharacterized protein n=1 Tax=Oryza rufipogon TaxID=4529 RepID=A0A0E0N459_ORYRU
MGQCNLVPSFSSFFSLNFCVVFLIETHRAILERRGTVLVCSLNICQSVIPADTSVIILD